MLQANLSTDHSYSASSPFTCTSIALQRSRGGGRRLCKFQDVLVRIIAIQAMYKAQQAANQLEIMADGVVAALAAHRLHCLAIVSDTLVTNLGGDGDDNVVGAVDALLQDVAEVVKVDAVVFQHCRCNAVCNSD